MCNTEAIIRHALQEGVKITLVVNKIDRLILELRIKPADAYYKIKHTIEEVNTFIRCVLYCCIKRCLRLTNTQWHKPRSRPETKPREW